MPGSEREQFLADLSDDLLGRRGFSAVVPVCEGCGVFWDHAKSSGAVAQVTAHVKLNSW